MATTATGMPSANEPNEDQTEVGMTVGGSLPAEGQDMGATSSTGESARAGEAQVAQERASQEWDRTQRAALLEQVEEAAAAAMRDERTDQETRRSTRTLKDITAHQKEPGPVCARQCAWRSQQMHKQRCARKRRPMREWRCVREPGPVRARQCAWRSQPMRRQQGARKRQPMRKQRCSPER
jgi:hypothetical protein